jgi:hypothetical protein
LVGVNLSGVSLGKVWPVEAETSKKKATNTVAIRPGLRTFCIVIGGCPQEMIIAQELAKCL